MLFIGNVFCWHLVYFVAFLIYKCRLLALISNSLPIHVLSQCLVFSVRKYHPAPLRSHLKKIWPPVQFHPGIPGLVCFFLAFQRYPLFHSSAWSLLWPAFWTLDSLLPAPYRICLISDCLPGFWPLIIPLNQNSCYSLKLLKCRAFGFTFAILRILTQTYWKVFQPIH